jgi:hypothetical protein
MGLTVGVVVDVRDVTGGAYLHAAFAAGIGLAVLLLAVLSGRTLSSRIARRVGAIAPYLAQVGRFNISRDPAPQSFIREVSELGSSVGSMKASLRSFAHYVPTNLVRRPLADGREAELGGEVRRLTIHFSDVANFTAISEGVDPDRLVEAMGRYFELMTGTIAHHGGTVDKVAVKGRTQGTLVCELLGLKGEVPAEILAARDLYEQALEAYFAAQFERAGELFEEAERLRPGDLAAAMMLARTHELADDPPLRWSSIYVMDEK